MQNGMDMKTEHIKALEIQGVQNEHSKLQLQNLSETSNATVASTTWQYKSITSSSADGTNKFHLKPKF